jgi:hypothetical protein
MATDTTAGLFSTPEQYQQAQLAQQQDLAMRMAQLTPEQRASAGMQVAGYQIGGGIGGAMGAQDPMLKLQSTRQQLAQGKDLSSYEGWANYAKELSQNNDIQGAMAAAEKAKGFQKTGQIQSRVQALIAKGVATNQTEAEAIASDDAAFREAMGLTKRTAADKLQMGLQTEAERRFPGDVQAQYTWIEEQKAAAAPLTASEREKVAGVAQANVTLDKSIQDVTKYLADIDPANPKVTFGVGSNVAGYVSGVAGYPTDNAQKQADIRSFLTKAQNDILNLAKGTQTDKDALRAQLQIMGNMPLNSNEAVQAALNRLKEIAETTKKANEAYEQSLTAGKKNAKVSTGGASRRDELLQRASPEQRKALGI